MIKVSDIASAIESAAPRSLQESWDNTGLQVGDPDSPVTGVMVGLDVTPALVDEAIAAGCDMVVSHHPLIFKGLKSVTGASEVERAVIAAIRKGVAIYSSHTALDNAAGGVSYEMAARLGGTVLEPLEPLAGLPECGTGVIARFPQPLTPEGFISRVKERFDAPVARTTDPKKASPIIERVALCGGSGGPFIGDAVKAGCQAYVTGDVRYHDFLDWGSKILIVDIGHHETEALTKDLLADMISKRFPNLKVIKSGKEENPIKYI